VTIAVATAFGLMFPNDPAFDVPLIVAPTSE